MVRSIVFGRRFVDPSCDTAFVLPSSISPQLCTLVAEVPRGDEWLHEIKYDGWRLLAQKDGGKIRLFTRGGIEWSARLPKLAAALKQVRARNAWLDGELVYVNELGYPQFHRVMGCVRASKEAALYYQVWDLPWHNGRSLAGWPLLERKQALSNLLASAPPRVRFTSHVVGNGAEFFKVADAHDLEGIVSKRVASHYRAGERTRDWLKLKCWRTYNLFVGGIERDDDGRLTALLVGSPDGNQLRYEGRVEFGLRRVRAAWIDGPGAAVSPFRNGPSARNRVWMDPNLAITVRALPRAAGEPLRHAVAMGIV
jgi:bifunctional non-homologous end joining protein LigD